jgi:potassium-transporting ATPase KdpC subunit
MKHLLPTIRITIFFTILLGFIYPGIVTVISQGVFNDQANGSLISKDGQVIGSKFLAQKFEGDKYFWQRPSSVDYNPLPSGGSNLSQNSTDLKKVFEERKAKLKASALNSGEPPQDLLYSSGSGLDPHISPEAAQYQLERVAKARTMETSQVQMLINQATEERKWGILGEPTVNVFALNLALDKGTK